MYFHYKQFFEQKNLNLLTLTTFLANYKYRSLDLEKEIVRWQVIKLPLCCRQTKEKSKRTRITGWESSFHQPVIFGNTFFALCSAAKRGQVSEQTVWSSKSSVWRKFVLALWKRNWVFSWPIIVAVFSLSFVCKHNTGNLMTRCETISFFQIKTRIFVVCKKRAQCQKNTQFFS